MGKISNQVFIVKIRTDKKTFEEWFEEHDEEVRSKAIEEFVEQLENKIKSEIDDCTDELDWIEQIAKQIKI